MKEPVLTVQDLCFTYQHAIVLKDVSFSVEQGDFFVVLGPNGGGKTTLLKLCLGILKPDSGTIKVFGQEPPNTSHKIGYVPQNTGFNVTFPISALEVALMGRLSRSRLGRIYSAYDYSMAEDALKKVGMWQHRFTPIGHMSGGQRQRVFIARALAADPEILFMDEPTAGVDPEFETHIYELFRQLNERVTIVLITHDIGVISQYAKTVACVNRTIEVHREGQITKGMLEKAYGCPVELVAHGIPHRVYPVHKGGH